LLGKGYSVYWCGVSCIRSFSMDHSRNLHKRETVKIMLFFRLSKSILSGQLGYVITLMLKKNSRNTT
jgi:hypothetical protein